MIYPYLDQENLEKVLYSYLPAEEGFQKKLLESVNYSLKAGGKRLRPRLMLEMYRLCGGSEKVIEPFMAAMEMIHTYSLCHDDLPCMDNDTLRRGKPTTWSVFGEDFGVLAGDALLTFAFETACKGFAMTADLPSAAKAVAVLANKAGIYGMAGGQALDVELTGKPVSANEMDFIYRLKTGALIEASLMVGAVLAGRSEEFVLKAEKLGSLIGYAFQIRDDILDIVSTESELGKPIGSDEKNHKTTYASLYGLEKAGSEVDRLSREAAELARQMAGDNDCSYFIQLIDKLRSRKN